MLAAHDVTFGYGRRRARRAPVLDGVSLEAERGSIIGVLGPNGSGKSTLLRILAAMLTPHSGRVTLEGRPLAAFTRVELARRVAVVPQETQTAFDFTVIDMVLMGRYPHLGPFELEGVDDVEIAREALAATGTSALESRSFATLSGGEKQRVVIAGALAQATDVLLLDEPTAALDVAYQFDIAALLRRINVDRKTTIVLSTHDLNFAAAVCDRVVLLKHGRVLAAGGTAATITPANIRELYDVDADVTFHPRAQRLTVVPVARTQ